MLAGKAEKAWSVLLLKPLLSSHMCCMRGLLTCLFYYVTLLSYFPGWHFSGARLVVEELILWFCIYPPQKKAPEIFQLDCKGNTLLVSLIFAASLRKSLVWRIVYYSELSIPSESCFVILLLFHLDWLPWWWIVLMVAGLCSCFGNLCHVGSWAILLAAKLKSSKRCGAVFLSIVLFLL